MRTISKYYSRRVCAKRTKKLANRTKTIQDTNRRRILVQGIVIWSFLHH